MADKEFPAVAALSSLGWASSLHAAVSALAAQNGCTAHYVIRHGSMRVGIYKPVKVDAQTPHQQDELYFIVGGSGYLMKNGQTLAVSPGDVLFVEAGVDHRFYDFTEDFLTWVIFWGPEGGEPGRVVNEAPC